MASAADVPITTEHKRCDAHPQERYQRYCQDCDKLVCIECIVGKHKHHNCVKITEILNTKRKEIIQYIKDLKRREIMYLKERSLNIKANIEINSKDLKVVKSDIIEKAKTIKAEVDVVRDEFIRSLEKKEKEDILFLRKMEEKNEKGILEIEKFVQNCDAQIRALQETDVLEFVADCKEALAKYTEETENPMIHLPTLAGNIDKETIRHLFGYCDKKEAETASERVSPCVSLSEKLKTLRLRHIEHTMEQEQEIERVKLQEGNLPRAEYFKRTNESRAFSTSRSVSGEDHDLVSDYENSSDSADVDLTAPRKSISVISCLRNEKKPTALAATTSNELWVSDYNGRLIKLKNGFSTISFKSQLQFCTNALAVKASGDLFINNPSDRKICILTNKGKLDDFIVTAPFTPEGICVTDNGDILVTLYQFDYVSNKSTGKVLTYSSTGKFKQSIQYDKTGNELFKNPCFVAENQNGDIWVTDLETQRVIVVTTNGQLRFQYSGKDMGTNFTPRGVVCNVHSQGLIVDNHNDAVHLVDKDGEFLGLLLTKHDGLRKPYSLAKDQTGRFYLGCVGNNKLLLFSFIQ